MKKYCLFSILTFLCCITFGQNAGKTGGVDENAIGKIGSVPISAVSKTGNITAQVYFKNCKEIKQNNPAAVDGMYTIDPDGEGSIEPFDCFCDMTANGGGWNLVGYYRFPADYEFLMFARNDAAYEIETGTIGHIVSVTPWTDWRVLAGVSWPIEFAVVVNRTQFMGFPWEPWENYTSKVIYRVKNREILPNYGTIQDLTSDDNLYYKILFSDGWTDVGSASMSTAYIWYTNDAAGNYLICFHYCCDYTTYFGNGVPEGTNQWYYDSRLFVR